METKDYVTFEVAKLLKEKGCNIPSKHYYRDDSDDIFESNWFLYNKQNYGSIECIALSLYDAQEWLRNIYQIAVMPSCCISTKNKLVYSYNIYILNNKKDIISSIPNYASYEESLNEGIKEALKLI